MISGAGGILGVLAAYGLTAAFADVIRVQLDIPYLNMSLAEAAPVAGLCIGLRF